MSRDYYARVGGAGLSAETYPIDRDTDDAAIDSAFAACSPFGHSLWDGRRFLGYFDAGEGRLPRLVAAHADRAASPLLPC